MSGTLIGIAAALAIVAAVYRWPLVAGTLLAGVCIGIALTLI